jgi:hypothetical protein
MLWLETLGEAWEKTGWRIHAWVMMNNHYHPRSVKYKRARPRAIYRYQCNYRRVFNKSLFIIDYQLD